MEIIRISPEDNYGTEGFFVRVNKKEAANLIRSIAEQLFWDNPNQNRLESFAKTGEYFTISVSEPATDKADLFELADRDAKIAWLEESLRRAELELGKMQKRVKKSKSKKTK